MPKRSRNGPPYTDTPDGIYVVVVYPCGMNRYPSMRVQRDFDNIAAWARFVLQQRGLGGDLATVEGIYSMKEHDEIIIQFADGTDVIPLLGEHRWANIIRNWRGSADDDRATRVFIYNWRDNGDPGKHNWTLNFPNKVSLDEVPTKSPYPAPSWTSRPNSLSLANLVLPIPPPPIPPPVFDRVDIPNPNQEQQLTTPLPPSLAEPVPAPPEQGDQRESNKQPMAQNSADQPTTIFRPYEPPSHARSLQIQHADSNNATPSQALPMPPPPKFIKKLDPYELEEDAFNILRSPDPVRVEEDTKPAVKTEEINLALPVSIKMEDGSHSSSQVLPPASLGYQPTVELERYISAHLQRATASPSAPGAIKAEDRSLPQVVPPASLGYRPTAELERCINVHLQGPRLIPPTRVTVKREYEEDIITSLGESKRIKVEEM